MRLLQITDCHLLADKARCAYGQVNPYASLAQCLKLSAALIPDGILFTGDISGDDSALSYQHFTSLYTRICGKTPFRVIAGNHDVNPHFNRSLQPAILQSGSPWQLGCWMIHGMDSSFKGTRGQVGPEQMQHVKNAVSAHTDFYHLAAMHHHPVATGSWMDDHALEDASEVCRWFEQTKGISALIYGHIHTARQCQIDGRSVMSAPSSCWQWQMTEQFGVENSPPGLRVLDLSADGTITTFIRRTE